MRHPNTHTVRSRRPGLTYASAAWALMLTCALPLAGAHAASAAGTDPYQVLIDQYSGPDEEPSMSGDFDAYFLTEDAAVNAAPGADLAAVALPVALCIIESPNVKV